MLSYKYVKGRTREVFKCLKSESCGSRRRQTLVRCGSLCSCYSCYTSSHCDCETRANPVTPPSTVSLHVLVIPVTPPHIVILRLAPTLSHLLALCPSMFLLFLLHLLILIWDSLLPNNKSLHFSCYTSPHWMWDSRPSCYTFLHSLALVIPSMTPHRPAPTHRYQTYLGFPTWFTVENHLVTGIP